jgi:hypothetical protein
LGNTPPPPEDCATLPASGRQVCKYKVKDWCNAATSPPDLSYNDNRTISDKAPLLFPVVWDTMAACVRFTNSGPWACGHGFGVIVSMGIFTYPLGDCTRNP